MSKSIYDNFIVVYGQTKEWEPHSGDYLQSFSTEKNALSCVKEEIIETFKVDDRYCSDDYDSIKEYMKFTQAEVKRYSSYLTELSNIDQNLSEEEKLLLCSKVFEKLVFTSVFFTGHKKILSSLYKEMLESSIKEILKLIKSYEKDAVDFEKKMMKTNNVKTSSELEEKNQLKMLLKKYGIPREFLQCNS
jgi:hypothetical protein